MLSWLQSLLHRNIHHYHIGCRSAGAWNGDSAGVGSCGHRARAEEQVLMMQAGYVAVSGCLE